jgi:hypothetical protein
VPPHDTQSSESAVLLVYYMTLNITQPDIFALPHDVRTAGPFDIFGGSGSTFLSFGKHL